MLAGGEMFQATKISISVCCSFELQNTFCRGNILLSEEPARRNCIFEHFGAFRWHDREYYPSYCIMV